MEPVSRFVPLAQASVIRTNGARRHASEDTTCRQIARMLESLDELRLGYQAGFACGDYLKAAYKTGRGVPIAERLLQEMVWLHRQAQIERVVAAWR